MKIKFLVACTLTVFALNARAFANESISLSRNIVVESCAENGACQELESQKQIWEDVTLKLSPFRKGKVNGVHGENIIEIVANGIPFKSKIFVNKVDTGYSIYAVLHSGKGRGRNGVTVKELIPSAADFKTIHLVDKPITIDSKTYRANLTIRSAAKSL